MSDIPEDIRETARKVADATVNRFLDLGMMTVVPNAERKLVAERFARALMAERVASVNAAANRYHDGAGPETWDYFKAAERAIRNA